MEGSQARRTVSRSYYFVHVLVTYWCATFYRLEIFNLVYDLHSLGIVHGDLEPRNVVRTDEGKLLLIDFTHSSRHRSESCVTQHVCQLVVHSHCLTDLTSG